MTRQSYQQEESGQGDARRDGVGAMAGAAMVQQYSINSEEIDRSLSEANLLRVRKQRDDAISVCTRVLRMAPANATAHALMGDIYRDEGNFQEALGWYKLAVQLDPANAVDRKKLDEMIDRVFQSARQGEAAKSSKKESVPAETAEGAKPSWLERITPTHVIIAFSLLAVLVFVGILLFPKFTAMQRPGTPAAPAASVPDVPAAAAPSTLTPPAPDATEQPAAAAPTVPPTGTAPGTTPVAPPTAKPPVSPPENKPTVARVPPFEVKPQRMTEEEQAKAEQKIEAALEEALKTSRLQSALNEIELDPRSKMLTITYTIPHMTGPLDTKQGLIYSGFTLVWAADSTNSMIRSYNLKGLAYKAGEKEPTLALVTDVTPQQADAAREAGDYKAAAKYMMNAWWRDDLDTTPL